MQLNTLTSIAEDFKVSILVSNSKFEVDDRTVSLKDIAQIVFNTNVKKIKSDDIRNLLIAEVPEIGIQKVVHGKEIVAKIQEIENSIGYYIPDKIKITRKGRALDNFEIVDQITKFLRNRDEGKEVKRLKRYSPREIPLNTVSFEIEDVLYQANIARVRLNAVTDIGEKYPINAEIELEKFVKVPLVLNGLVQGTKITDKDLVMAKVDFSRIPRGVITNPKQIVNKVVTKNLRSGDYFVQNGIRGEYLVQKSKEVIAIFQSGGLLLELKGIALENGAEGENIKVRNPSSNKIVQGEVIGNGQVLVK